ncbi:sel1 repeat family protein [Photobacterium sagamiensis]|uniref:tetratricopeptide repeat protein n=1 Tax=Photobacterium sagamiensis TaxID=2910241 RepID=UPI003D0F2C6A
MRTAIIYIGDDQRGCKVGSTIDENKRKNKACTDNPFYELVKIYEVDEVAYKDLETKLHHYLGQFFTVISHKSTNSDSEWYDTSAEMITPYVERMIFEYRWHKEQEKTSELNEHLLSAEQDAMQAKETADKLENMSVESSLMEIITQHTFSELEFISVDHQHRLFSRCVEYHTAIKKRIEEGDHTAMYIEALRRINTGDLSYEAVSMIMKAANNNEHAKIFILETLVDKAYFNDAEALLNMGLSFKSGELVTKNDKLAMKFIEQSAQLGNRSAMFNLGCCYFFGTGADKDYGKAFNWYQKAAEQGHSNAMYNLACCYSDGTGIAKDCDKAFNWYQKAAEQGDTKAMFNLACCYSEGRGVDKDCGNAFKWLQKAAAQGKNYAMFELGVYFESGIGTDRDPNKAFKWYQKAANKNNEIAMYNLANCYRHGIGTAKAPKKCYLWAQKAAEFKDGWGILTVGACLEHGFGVEKSLSSAIRHYRHWSEKGSSHAMIALHKAYTQGKLTSPDQEEATQWLNLALETTTSGLTDEADYYLDKTNLGTDSAFAISLYTEAANRGSREAIESLIDIYQDGEHIEKDKETTLYWQNKLTELPNDRNNQEQ